MSDPDPSSSATPQTPPPGESSSSRDREFFVRVLYMILFAVAFWILCWTLAVTVVVQLVLRLLNGQPQADVARFGAGLASYAKQVIEFLTFSTERLPFPFSGWPDPAYDRPAG